jgi:hypothetical protein
MDNCWRENKNKYVFGYASYLVQQKVFKNVIISYFQVGHTHNDVDQLFSKISHHLRSTNAITLEELHQCVKESTSSSVTLDCNYIENVPNISKMMDEDGWLNPICGHTDPRVFQFEETQSGEVGIMFKRNMRDSEFCNVDGAFVLLKQGHNISHNTPMCQYKGVESAFIRNVRISLDACSNRINNGYKMILLKELAERLENPSICKFSWNLSLYNIQISETEDFNQDFIGITQEELEQGNNYHYDDGSETNSQYEEQNSVKTSSDEDDIESNNIEAYSDFGNKNSNINETKENQIVVQSTYNKRKKIIEYVMNISLGRVIVCKSGLFQIL